MNCRHEGCTCQVGDEGFCSDHCREHAGDGHDTHACECGHPACSASAAGADSGEVAGQTTSPADEPAAGITAEAIPAVDDGTQN